MDAAALGRYRFLQRIGVFGIELDSARGAREFLLTSTALLARPDTALWITAQGRFVDARDRPPGLRPGFAHLSRRLERAVVLPRHWNIPSGKSVTPRFWCGLAGPFRLHEASTKLLRNGGDASNQHWPVPRTPWLAMPGVVIPPHLKLCWAARLASAASTTCGAGLALRLAGNPFRPEHGGSQVLSAPGDC